MKKRLLLVTRQAGAVEAFASVLKCLSKDQWEYEILAYDESRIAWDNLGYRNNSRRFKSESDISKYDLLLTDTSEKVSDTSFFWDAAIEYDVPGIAFVDSWVNYSERFTENTRFDRTPHFIGLIDELMYRRMIENGAPMEKLVILGHPRFDTVLKKYSEYRKLIAEENGFNIVFYTDPVESNIPYTDEGYNTKDVVRFVLLQFANHPCLNKKVNIIIKPHPRESPDDYLRMIDDPGFRNFVSVSNEDPYKLMGKAGAVFGLNTILLVDSSKLGIPTYSFQPGRKMKRNDITDRANINVKTTWDDIRKEIHTMTPGEWVQKRPAIVKNESVKRFIDFINRFSNTS